MKKMSLLPGGTTEWEDIQVRLGNFAPREAEPTRDEVEEQLLDAATQVDVLAKSSLRTLDRLIEHDGGDDDELRELERIRNARLEELVRKKSEICFGRVFGGVNKQNFVDQVTKASEKSPVLCHMFAHRSVLCGEVTKVFEFLANRHKSIKFVSGVASEIVGAEFPESNLPFVVFYHHGACVQQIPRARPEDVARLVAESTAQTRPDSDSEHEDISDLSRQVISRANADDREYSSLFFNRHVLRRK